MGVPGRMLQVRICPPPPPIRPEGSGLADHELVISALRDRVCGQGAGLVHDAARRRILRTAAEQNLPRYVPCLPISS